PQATKQTTPSDASDNITDPHPTPGTADSMIRRLYAKTRSHNLTFGVGVRASAASESQHREAQLRCAGSPQDRGDRWGGWPPRTRVPPRPPLPVGVKGGAAP